ncbi:MAG: hypothetical protein ACI8YQ_002854 [Polaribacter sp.]|jgi:hypothetical protein
MENSKKIQLGLLVVVAGLLIANMTGAFSGMFGGGDSDVRAAAKESIATTTGVNNNSVTPSAAGATKAGDASAAAPAAPAGPTTTVDFEETEFDFGTIAAGEKVNHVYKFKNTGNEPLIISNAKGSCGCTVPSWPKEPIPVGGTGEISVQFDSKGKKNKQSKRVTITANTDPAQSFLTIKGDVTPDAAAEAAKAAKKAAAEK